MRDFSCKKILAAFLALVIVITLAPMAIVAETSDTVVGDGGKWEQYCKATIVFDGTDTTLTLNFFDRNYDGFTGDYSAQLQNLIPRAVDTYNTNHGTTLTGESINKLVVTVNEGFSLHLASFIGFLTSSTYGGYAANLTELDLSGATFRNARNGEDITKETKTINNNVFAVYEGSSNFPKLKILKLGKGHEIIGGSAFNNMTSLEEVVIPDNYTAIYTAAFKGCTSLKAIDIPAGINALAAATSVLNGCTAVEKISYHGEDVSLFDTIMGYINLSTVTKVDLSGSGITNANALSVLSKTNLTYLNISDCNNIEYQSDEGVNLYKKLVTLEATGAEVLAPVNPDADIILDTVVGDGGKWDNTTTARIKVDGEETILALDFSLSFENFTTEWTPRLDLLIPRAVETYNANHSTAFTIASINKVVITTAENVDVSRHLVTTLHTILVPESIIELDFSNASMSDTTYSDDSGELRSNVFSKYLGESFFPNIKILRLGGCNFTSIGYQAFNNMTSLEVLELPKTLVNIAIAFDDCTCLKEIEIPVGVNTLGSADYIFLGCEDLASISYHGIAAGSTNKATFYTELADIVKNAPITEIDLSGTNIDTTNALAVASKRRITYINFKDCSNIEFVSENGVKLYERLKELEKLGATVIIPDGSVSDHKDDSATVYSDGENTLLTLYYANNYYNLQGDGYNDVNDFRGRTIQLVNAAIDDYNSLNETQLTLSDITTLNISTADDVFLIGDFASIIKEKFPQVKEINMKNSNVTTRNFSSETSGYTDNAIPEQYFGSNQEVALSNIKKIVLPASLEIINNYAFKGLSTLEEIEFGSCVKSIGYEAFSDCSALKVLDLSHSGIDSDSALTAANKADIEYLDLSGCVNIEYKSDTGKELYAKLTELKKSGVTVLMPGSDAVLKADEGKLSLEIYFFESDDCNRVSELASSALSVYNSLNSCEYTFADINAVALKTSENNSISSFVGDYIIENFTSVSKIDVSKTGIENEAVLSIVNNSRIEYLNISNCNAIDYSTSSGAELLTKLTQMINNGINIVITDVYGDANGDNDFNIIDLVRLKKYLIGVGMIFNSESLVDFDCDNQINATELTFMRKALLGEEELEKYTKRMASAYNLTVSNDTMGEYKYMGWFLNQETVNFYQEMQAETREQFCKYVFEGEQVNYIGIIVKTDKYISEASGFDIEQFKADWHSGQNGLLDKLAEMKMPIFANISRAPSWMKGESPYWLAAGYEEEFSELISDVAYKLIADCGLNIANISLGDEPDLLTSNWDSETIEYYYETVPLIRAKLDNLGLSNVEIIGPNSSNISYKWLNVLKADAECWENISAVNGHDFSCGRVNSDLTYSALVFDKPFYVTSMGILDTHTVASDYIKKNSKGEESIADYYTTMRNVSAYLNDVNKGAAATVLWTPLVDATSYERLDSLPSNFWHLYFNKNGKVFDGNLAVSSNYDYYSQMLNTVKPGAAIYQCSTDKEGVPGASFENYTISASAGINNDGTWGINIFNKTDSTVAAPHKGKQNAPVPQAAKTITVKLDIKGLYGTGNKEFKIYSSSTQGNASKEIGSVILTDGKGIVDVQSLELISLRSVESIGLVSEPTSISEEIKDLTVAYNGNNYIFKNGEKIALNSAPELKYFKDFTNVAVGFEAEDFAKIIGADYTVNTENKILSTVTTIRIANSVGEIKFTVTDNLITADTQTVTYSGAVSGTLALPETFTYSNNKIYFALSDYPTDTISNIFGINYRQYENTGLIVVGDTDIVNIGKFSDLFE